jgi:hypothetical protein
MLSLYSCADAAELRGDGGAKHLLESSDSSANIPHQNFNSARQGLASIEAHDTCARRTQDREEHAGGALAGLDIARAAPSSAAALEARMGNRGKREFIQVLRLMEVFPETLVADAALDAIQLGAIGVDAVKQLVIAKIERRPANLDLCDYPYLPAPNVKATSAADYAVLVSVRAA